MPRTCGHRKKRPGHLLGQLIFTANCFSTARVFSTPSSIRFISIDANFTLNRAGVGRFNTSKLIRHCFCWLGYLRRKISKQSHLSYAFDNHNTPAINAQACNAERTLDMETEEQPRVPLEGILEQGAIIFLGVSNLLLFFLQWGLQTTER